MSYFRAMSVTQAEFTATSICSCIAASRLVLIKLLLTQSNQATDVIDWMKNPVMCENDLSESFSGSSDDAETIPCKLPSK